MLRNRRLPSVSKRGKYGHFTGKEPPDFPPAQSDAPQSEREKKVQSWSADKAAEYGAVHLRAVPEFTRSVNIYACQSAFRQKHPVRPLSHPYGMFSAAKKQQNEKNQGMYFICKCLIMNGAPGGDRTHDPLLRRQLLYPLSYQGIIRKSCTLAPDSKKSTIKVKFFIR